MSMFRKPKTAAITRELFGPRSEEDETKIRPGKGKAYQVYREGGWADYRAVDAGKRGSRKKNKHSFRKERAFKAKQNPYTFRGYDAWLTTPPEEEDEPPIHCMGCGSTDALDFPSGLPLCEECLSALPGKDECFACPVAAKGGDWKAIVPKNIGDCCADCHTHRTKARENPKRRIPKRHFDYDEKGREGISQTRSQAFAFAYLHPKGWVLTQRQHDDMRRDKPKDPRAYLEARYLQGEVCTDPYSSGPGDVWGRFRQKVKRNGKKSERDLRISEKIEQLTSEGVPPRQAAAMAESMEKAGRLGRHGVYHAVGKQKGKRPTSGEGARRVAEKIIQLQEEEGVPRRQAVAMAISMEQAGRLGRHGEYRAVGEKKTPKAPKAATKAATKAAPARQAETASLRGMLNAQLVSMGTAAAKAELKRRGRDAKGKKL